MSTYLDEVFGPQGALAARFPKYVPRQGQVALAAAVDAALSRGTHLLAEAPTGTGKSVAYAVPAIFHAVRHRETNFLRHPDERPPFKVVIVTANIALQEQLVSKDLPLLAEILPWKFSYALLKGRGNYLCTDRIKEGSIDKPHPDDRKMIERVLAWAGGTTTGDFSELPFELSPRMKPHFTVSQNECLASDCPQEHCFSDRARKIAQEADIVVTNYNLFFLDMEIRRSSKGFASILPDYHAAILDEGHKAVEIVRDCIGFKVNDGSVRWTTKMSSDKELRREVEDASKRFFKALGNYKRTPKYKARIREQNAVDSEELDAKLDLLAIEYLDRLSAFPPIVEMTKQQRKKSRQLQQRLTGIARIRGQISQAMRLYTLPEPPWQEHPEHKGWWWSNPAVGGDNTVKNEKDVAMYNDVYFIDDEEDSSSPTLASKPISVARFLEQNLFARKEGGSVTVTSATLVARGSFDYVVNDLGVDRPATLVAASPFDFSKQALLVLPQDVEEDPNKPGFIFDVMRKCAETIELARGRTLALFTSKKNLNAAYDYVIKQNTGYRILKQWDMPRTKLIEEFKRDTNSVLMGVESFWAGVDVDGESLSCVFIDKIPFAPPEDPVMSTLAERDKDGWFNKYSLPKAIISFKQGFGRLIRSIDDRGVVVVLDRRITKKFYGSQFLYSLPPNIQKSHNLGDVRRFLDREPLVFTAPPPAATGASLFDRA